MLRLKVSLPDGLKKWVDTRVAEGRYSSVGDYIGDLVRQDQDRATGLARLQAEIDKGRASPIDPRTLSQIFADAKACCKTS